MKTKRTKPYEQPAMDVVELEICMPLCISGNNENDGYGNPINEGDSNGWST